MYYSYRCLLLIIISLFSNFNFAQPTITMDTTGWISYTKETDPLPSHSYEESMSGDSKNLHKYDSIQQQNFETLSQKYNILHHSFDSECIYQLGDLTSIIKEILQNLTPDLEFQIEPEVKNNEQQIYLATFIIHQKRYQFKTSTLGDYIDFEHNIHELNKIATDHLSDSEFRIPNYPGDQFLMVIFSNKDNLIKAVKEGFPCTIQKWQWANQQWPLGISVIVTLDQFPDEAILNQQYFQTMQNLHQKQFNISIFDQRQIYISDLFGNGLVCIMVNNALPFTNLRRDAKIRCDHSPWGILLAYVLVKHFKGVPTLRNGSKKKIKPIKPSDFLNMVEKALAT